MTSTIKEFMFTGLMATHAVKDMEAREELAPAPSLYSYADEVGFLVPVAERIRAASIKMQRSYRMLYVFEKAVRQLIAEQLTDADGPMWFDNRATKDMKSKYEQRLKSEKRNQWHRSIETDPIFYLDFGDLGNLIVNHWQEFEAFFPDQDWVRNRMKEAERCRNVVAHSKQLHSEDRDRLEMYLKDWIRQVG